MKNCWFRHSVVFLALTRCPATGLTRFSFSVPRLIYDGKTSHSHASCWESGTIYRACGWASAVKSIKICLRKRRIRWRNCESCPALLTSRRIFWMDPPRSDKSAWQKWTWALDVSLRVNQLFNSAIKVPINGQAHNTLNLEERVQTLRTSDSDDQMTATILAGQCLLFCDVVYKYTYLNIIKLKFLINK